MDPKLEQLLRSRKFWATNITLVIAALLHQTGQISGAQLAQTVTIATGVYVGSTALEDGLSNILGILIQDPTPTPLTDEPENYR